jgi:hypothetical protein
LFFDSLHKDGTVVHQSVNMFSGDEDGLGHVFLKPIYFTVCSYFYFDENFLSCFNAKYTSVSVMSAELWEDGR